MGGKSLKRICWFRNTGGATAVEYGLIAAAIAMAIMAIVFLMGDNLVLIFEDLSTSLK